MKHQIHHKEAKRSTTTEKAQSDKHGVRLPKWELIVILVLMLQNIAVFFTIYILFPMLISARLQRIMKNSQNLPIEFSVKSAGIGHALVDCTIFSPNENGESSNKEICAVKNLDVAFSPWFQINGKIKNVDLRDSEVVLFCDLDDAEQTEQFGKTICRFVKQFSQSYSQKSFFADIEHCSLSGKLRLHSKKNVNHLFYQFTAFPYADSNDKNQIEYLVDLSDESNTISISGIHDAKKLETVFSINANADSRLLSSMGLLPDSLRLNGNLRSDGMFHWNSGELTLAAMDFNGSLTWNMYSGGCLRSKLFLSLESEEISMTQGTLSFGMTGGVPFNVHGKLNLSNSGGIQGIMTLNTDLTKYEMSVQTEYEPGNFVVRLLPNQQEAEKQMVRCVVNGCPISLNAPQFEIGLSSGKDLLPRIYGNGKVQSIQFGNKNTSWQAKESSFQFSSGETGKKTEYVFRFSFLQKTVPFGTVSFPNAEITGRAGYDENENEAALSQNDGKFSFHNSELMLNKISCHIPLICRNESSQKGFLNIGEILYQNNVLGKITGPLSTARDKSVFCSAHGILMNQTIESDLRIHVKSDLDLILTAGVKMPLQKWQDSPASSRIFPFLEQWNLTGNVGGDVNFYYGEGRTYGDASLTCRDMNARYKGTDFAVSGLNFMMKFPDFPRMISEPDLQAGFTTLSQGKTMMRDGKILFHVNQKNECMVDSFHASMMKGMIQAEPFGLLDVVNGKKEISAVCTNFELASLLKQQGVGVFSGSTRVNGKMSMNLSKGVLLWSNGLFMSNPGEKGVICGQLSDLVSAADGGSVEFDFVKESLKNFDYSWLKILFSQKNVKQKNMAFQIQMEGSPVQPVHFRYNDEKEMFESSETPNEFHDIHLETEFNIPVK